LLKRFGGWPCFHDAEILQIHINRGGISELRIVASYASPSERLLHSATSGVIVFEFSGISALRLEGEDADVQNVISDLEVERRERRYGLGWDSLFGMAGDMEVEKLRVRLEPQAADPV
jgi:hypothetical protein